MAITAMPSLSPSSCTRTANSISYDLPARGQRYGLTTFLIYHTTGLGFAYLPGASDNSVTSIACPCRLQSVARLVNYQYPYLDTESNDDKSDSYAVKRIRVARN